MNDKENLFMPLEQHENGSRLGDTLRAFEGTPLAETLATTLEARGVAPAEYNPDNYDNYYGLPVAYSNEYEQDDETSPVAETVNTLLVEGKLVLMQTPLDGQHVVKTRHEYTPTEANPYHGLHMFTTQAIVDRDTGQLAAWRTAVPHEDGVYAISAPVDLVIVDKQTGREIPVGQLTGETI